MAIVYFLRPQLTPKIYRCTWMIYCKSVPTSVEGMRQMEDVIVESVSRSFDSPLWYGAMKWDSWNRESFGSGASENVLNEQQLEP